MDETVDGGQRHGWFDEYLAPLRERRVGCNRQALVLVAFGDEFEQHRGFRLIAPDVAEVIQDQQVVAIQLGQFLWQSHVAPGGLQSLHDVAASGEQHATPGFDQCVPEAAHEMALADPGRSEQQHVGAAIEPLVAFGQRGDESLRDARYRGEVEARQPLVRDSIATRLGADRCAASRALQPHVPGRLQAGASQANPRDLTERTGHLRGA